MQNIFNMDKDGAIYDNIVMSVRNLNVTYRVREGLIRSSDGVTLDIERGRVTALIGESGSGKSTMIQAMLGILAPNGKVEAGSEIIFGGENVLKYSPEELRKFRWRRAAMVFQAAQNALSPTLKIKYQMLDTAFDHGIKKEEEILKKASGLLELVRLEPRRALEAYPHELSGGMRQRVIIALAMLLDPELLILDEPTTALDVITQSYIFDLIAELHEKLKISMLFITHDLSAVAKLAHRVAVLYAGKVLEIADVEDLFNKPGHPYTRGLLGSIPSIEGDTVKRNPIPGNPPDLINKPKGCVFHPRCAFAIDECSRAEPKYIEVADRHLVTCLRAREI